MSQTRSKTRFIRRRRFVATHHYWQQAWSEDENRAAFGAQADPHQHDWMLEVRIVGPVDPTTGFSVDLVEIDRSISDVITGWDGGDLNAVIPEVASGAVQPTTEELAHWVYDRLLKRMPISHQLEVVAVFESDDLGSEYPAGHAP